MLVWTRITSAFKRFRSLARAKAEPGAAPGPEPVRAPHATYAIGSWLFLRVLGLAHFFAFISLSQQVEGLVGANGILPAHLYLDRVHAHFGAWGAWRVPTVFWLSSTDEALVAVHLAGATLAIVLLIGIAERWILVVLWALYLSVCSVGQAFTAFQWDILLIEASVVGLFIARPQRFAGLPRRPPSSWALLVVHLLLAKLVFSSGWVKLASGDPHWAAATAMRFHYETQPLPTWVGWVAHQLPDGWHRLEAVSALVIQLGATPFVFTRWRGWAALPLIGLQVLIALTGNYCFFNLLTVGLCATLISDQVWRWWFRGLLPPGDGETLRTGPGTMAAAGVVAALVALPLWGTVWPAAFPAPVASVHRSLRPLRSFNAYGLFARMTTERYEIEVQGSHDGVEWRPYRLPHKPGPVDRRPGFVAPLQPRLDWQMWFAALGSARQNPWLGHFLLRLLEGAPQVTELLADDPFAEEPPKFVRAVRYRYTFTGFGDKGWWTRTPAGDYFPTMSLSGRLGRP